MKSEEPYKFPRTVEEYRRPLEFAEQVSMAVCQEFKRIREKKKMTHMLVAVKAGVSRGMIQHMETGFRNPTLMMAYTVANALGVSLADVIKKVEKQQKSKKASKPLRPNDKSKRRELFSEDL